MAPLFTFNFLDGLLETSLNDENDTSPLYPGYLISDDYSSLIPEFNFKKKATFKLSADKQSGTITQTMQENFEGDVYTVTYEATLLKTKY